MNLKNWLVAAAITILPKAVSAKVSSTKPDSIKTSSVEISTDSIPSQSIVTAIDSVAPDSLLYEKRLELLRESKKDMLLLIAHFESIKAHAYWDNVAKMYSVGFGFTRKKDGSRVNAATVIRSEEELMDYWERFTEEKMFPYMAKYLEIENTDHQERVSLGSTAFNCGAGIYKQKDEDAPSKYAETLNTFFKTKDSIYLNKALYSLEQRCKSRGRVVEALKKRRRVEGDILSHKILLVNNDTLAQKSPTDSTTMTENMLDLNKTIIGATYSIGTLPQDSTELATKLREYNQTGYDYTDSLQRAFSVPIPIKRRARKTPPKPRHQSGGR